MVTLLDLMAQQDPEKRRRMTWDKALQDLGTAGHPMSISPLGILYRTYRDGPAALQSMWETIKTPGDIAAGRKPATVDDAARFALDVGLVGLTGTAPKGALRSGGARSAKGLSWADADRIARERLIKGDIGLDEYDHYAFALRQNGDTPAAIAAAKQSKLEAIARQKANQLEMRRMREARAKLPPPKKTRIKTEILSEPDGRSPEAAWGARDLQDYRKEAKAGEEVIDGFVRLSELPQDRLAGGKTGYDWSELQRGGAIPPVTIRINRNGSTSILDGNHRIHWFREQGYDSIPAYIIRQKK